MARSDSLSWLQPDWPAPENIKAGTTLRTGGVSQPPYDSLNLGDHVGDDPTAVTENRQRLFQLGLPSEPIWLKQVHSKQVVDAPTTQPGEIEADGSYTSVTGIVCAVMTADCLPVLICNQQGTQVAAVHAGWRGLADGIIETAIDKFNDEKSDLLVWLGPAIGPNAYEVGDDVRDAFVNHDPHAESAFIVSNNKWLMDIYTLARQRLTTSGVNHIYSGEHCTYNNKTHFYSYRRDGITGRMASLIWIE
ncbi:MAG: peptidoglycan editing factor PgeF [Gammaproteobacteria bacterium]|nr:peptidoglycan editing factor PgeF [Gammaproteobacteria bacterium]